MLLIKKDLNWLYSFFLPLIGVCQYFNYIWRQFLEKEQGSAFSIPPVRY